MAQRRYPDCVPREGSARLRPLEDVVSLPRRSPIARDIGLALVAASSLHGVRSDLAPVPVRPTATTSEAGAYRFRKREPIDLRVSVRSGRVALGFLHELGHFVDHQLGYDPRNRVWASAIHPAFGPWRAAAAMLAARPFPGGRSRQRYFESAHEVWARGYAQTVLLRSNDAGLLEQLGTLQEADDPFVWPTVAFEPVALEVERVFERLGLTQLALPIAA
jgi:hypothetical protein